MNEKMKYVTILLLAVVVSSATSYLTTLAVYPSNAPQPSISPILQPTISPTLQPTSIRILPTYNVTISVEDSYVQVFSTVAFHNLTIVYQYTTLNGTSKTAEVGYGDYYPIWGVGVIIDSGAIPYVTCRIPNSIMSACSTTKIIYTDGIQSGIQFDIYPQLNVTEVYGYS